MKYGRFIGFLACCFWPWCSSLLWTWEDFGDFSKKWYLNYYASWRARIRIRIRVCVYMYTCTRTYVRNFSGISAIGRISEISPKNGTFTSDSAKSTQSRGFRRNFDCNFLWVFYALFPKFGRPFFCVFFQGFRRAKKKVTRLIQKTSFMLSFLIATFFNFWQGLHIKVNCSRKRQLFVDALFYISPLYLKRL